MAARSDDEYDFMLKPDRGGGDNNKTNDLHPNSSTNNRRGPRAWAQKLRCCDRSGAHEGRKCKIFQADNVLLMFTVGAVVVGITLGLVLRATVERELFGPREFMYLKFPGEIFMRMLKMCILPLIVASLVSSLAQLHSETAGKLGMYTMIYYFSTTFMAVIEGIILVLTIRPGHWTQSYKIKTQDKDICMSKAVDTILDLMRNLFPENLVEACTKSLKTCSHFVNVTINEFGNKTSETLTPHHALTLSPEERDRLKDIPKLDTSDGMNILGLVCFSCLFGFIISRMGEEGKPLMRFFRSLEGAMMRLISWVIWYSPVGITFLIAAQIVEMEDPKEELHRLTGYMITVLTGLAIHGLIVLPLLLIIFARRNPITFVYGMLQALLTALGTSSSSATLPLSIKCLEENNGIDPRVTRFMLPLGATINMDGTALYEAVAAIYIAQTLRKVLSMGEVILVSLTATLASIGAAGIPQAGIVTMIMVLIAVGLPTQYFVLILPVDWFLDRIRTTVNVHGDSIGAGIVNKLCEAQLKAEAEETQQTPTQPPRHKRPSIQVDSDDEHRI